MKPEEMQALAKALAPVIREMVTQQNEALRLQMREEIRSAVACIEFPAVDLAALRADESALTEKVLASIKAPTIDEAALIQRVLAGITVPAVDEAAMAERVLAAVVLPAPLAGLPGKDADAAMVKAAFADMVTEMFTALELQLANTLDAAIKAIPVPKDGEKGAPGQDGAPGNDGAPGAAGIAPTIEEISAPFELRFAELVNKAIAALPVAKDGAPGKDGISPTVDEVALQFERRFGEQLLAFERRFSETVAKAAENLPSPKDGAPGKDGTDAFPLESFDAELAEDGRTVILTFRAGALTVERKLRFPTVNDCGVYLVTGPERGGDYLKGDGVTYAGSFFIAQKDSPQGAPEASPDWRLAVKRGRDGRDLRPSASTHDKDKGVSL